MTFDLEEQEQLEELKAWWKENGGRLVAILLVAAIAFGGWQGWRHYQRSQSTKAGALYAQLTHAAQSGDAKLVGEASAALTQDFPRTYYAAMGSLVAGKFYFDRHDPKTAEAKLRWALEHASSDDLRDLARLRVAAVLLDEGKNDDALKLLDAPHADAYAAQYAALRGDVLVAKKEPDKAKAAYRKALDKIGTDDDSLRASVRLRLDALGG